MRRIFVVLLSMALALCFTEVAWAASTSSQLSWTAPTTREDGSPLASTDIAKYNVYYMVDPANGFDQSTATKVVVTGATSKTITINLNPRASPYDLEFAVTAVDTAGRESALSNVVKKSVTVVSTSPPGPPTSVTFTIQCASGCTIQ